MSSFPLLIRILATGRIQEALIVHGCRFVVLQVVKGGGAEKKAHRYFGLELVADVERLDGQRVILIFIGGNGQAAISCAEVRFEFDGGDELLLRFGKLVFFEEHLAELAVDLGVIRMYG